MPVNDTDRFLVNNGTKTETITFAQFQDGTVLNDTDRFLINDGTKTETVTWANIQDELGPKGIVNQPTVVKPKDGAGSGGQLYLKSDAITKVEGGGIGVCETDEIQSVDTLIYSAGGDNTNAIGAPGGDATWENAFNGISGGVTNTNGAQPKVNSTMTWSGSIAIPEDSTVTLVYYKQSNQTLTISINNNPISTVVTAGNSDWNTGTVDITAQAGSAITEISIARSSSGINSAIGLSGIQIDGEYLFDGQTQLTFPTSNGFNCFDPGDVVQDPDVKVISKDDSNPFTITVDGGEWTGSDGSGTPGEQTTLTKETPYDTKLTVAGSTDLADMTGAVLMTDGIGAPGP